MVIVLQTRDCLVYRWLYCGSYINMKRKMTEEELSTLMIYKITVITTDKKGKETIWRTTSDVDHSYLNDGWDIENFEEDK